MTKRLFFKADPMRGESIYGYLSRLAPILGYDSYKWIFDAFPGLFKSRTFRCLSTAPNLAPVADALGQSVEHLDAMRFPRRDGRLFCRGQEIRRIYVNFDSLYFCPLCTSERGTHMLVWQFNFLVACPIHHVKMLSRCAECDASLDMPSVKRGRCDQCFKGIGATHSSNATLAEAVTSLLSLIGGLTGSDEPGELPPVLEDADFSLALELVFAVGRIKGDVNRTGIATMRNGMELRLSQGYEMFKSWESSSQWLLARAARPYKGTITVSPYRRLFCRGTNEKIRKRAEDEISKFLYQQGETAKEEIRNGELVRIDDAAERVGMTKVSLKKIGERRPYATTRSKWRKATYLRNKEVHWIQSCVDECISSKDACRSLGVSDRHQVQALYDNYIFPHADPSMVLDRRSRCFRRESIDEFCQKVGRLPVLGVDPVSEMPWRAAKATFMSHHNTSADFYRAVVTDRLVPVSRQTGRSGFPSLIFLRREVLSIARMWSTFSTGATPVPSAFGQHRPSRQ
ncbi:TniQ family protein [Ferrovibrio terrae]|uniref:TniQ family protein n=1 Tax=Ferrovibrio terrae TaxID=2594003 RepID=UPI0031377126